jgi:hypothetical protein
MEIDRQQQHLLILVVRGVFNDNDIIPLGSPFPCVCPYSRGGEGGAEICFFTSPYNNKKA